MEMGVQIADTATLENKCHTGVPSAMPTWYNVGMICFYRTNHGGLIRVLFARDEGRMATKLQSAREHTPGELVALAALPKCGEAALQELCLMLAEDVPDDCSPLQGWFKETNRVKAAIICAQARPNATTTEYIGLVDSALNPRTFTKSEKQRNNPLSRANMRKARIAAFQRQLDDGMQISISELSQTEGET